MGFDVACPTHSACDQGTSIGGGDGGYIALGAVAWHFFLKIKSQREEVLVADLFVDRVVDRLDLKDLA